MFRSQLQLVISFVSCVQTYQKQRKTARFLTTRELCLSPWSKFVTVKIRSFFHLFFFCIPTQKKQVKIVESSIHLSLLHKRGIDDSRVRNEVLGEETMYTRTFEFCFSWTCRHVMSSSHPHIQRTGICRLSLSLMHASIDSNIG